MTDDDEDGYARCWTDAMTRYRVTDANLSMDGGRIFKMHFIGGASWYFKVFPVVELVGVPYRRLPDVPWAREATCILNRRLEAMVAGHLNPALIEPEFTEEELGCVRKHLFVEAV